MKTARPYQQQCLDAIRRMLDEHYSTVAVLATGLGKTIVATKLIADWPRGNTLFLAHTTELIDQAADRLEAELGYRPAVEMGERRAGLDTLYQGGMCVVGSVQSMSGDKRLKKYTHHPFGLIIVDECHHATSSMYRRVIDYFRAINPGLKVVGLTATPQRTDGAALGIVFESEAFQMPISPAIEEGWLVPIRQQSVIVEGLDFSGLKARKQKSGEVDFSAEQLEAILMDEEMLHRMARPTVEMLGNRSSLVFTASVKHAHAMASVLRRYGVTAAALDGETPKDVRKETIRQFSSGNIQYLCNCALLTEGFDAPNCTAIVMGRPTKSLTLFTQMLGRGLRPLPGVVDGHADAMDRKLAILSSQKSECLVLDFAGVSQHKLVNSYDVLGGSYDVETRELAAREGNGKDPTEMLEKAQALLMLQRLWDARKEIVADAAHYHIHDADPFAAGARPVTVAAGGPHRGGASDAQVALLVGLGVPVETAQRYSKRQAGAVIDSLRTKRCTDKQARTLKRYGISTVGLGMDQASKMIDAIASNGWRGLPTGYQRGG